jgi:hypothetical protein
MPVELSIHRAVTFPLESIPSVGFAAVLSGLDIATMGVQLSPEGRELDMMTLFSIHTAVILLLESMTTRGDEASVRAVEMAVGVTAHVMSLYAITGEHSVNIKNKIFFITTFLCNPVCFQPPIYKY